MEDQLISFETAKLAKVKGFNEYCDKLYNLFGDAWNAHYGTVRNSNMDSGGYCTAPTQTTLQRWLREIHSIHIYINTTPKFDKIYGSKWQADIKYCFQPFKWTTGHYYIGDTYEEALEKALEMALKLIKS